MPAAREACVRAAAVLDRFQVACFLGAIAAAVVAGGLAPQQFSQWTGLITPFLAALLYVTFLQVPAGELVSALRSGPFPAALLLLNFVVVPLVVAALTVLLPGDLALRTGALLVLLCPCVDYVIVFSGLAGGDSRRLLAATPLLLLVQMALLPVFLWLFLGDRLTGVVELRPFVEAFVGLILVPLLLAWATQWLTRRVGYPGRAGRGVAAGASSLMVPLMLLVLFTVVASQVPRLEDRSGRLVALAGVYSLFIIVMVAAGLLAGRWSGLGAGERRALVFSGVTRNSLVVLPLALALPDGLAAAAAAAVVLQTLVELIGMTVLIRLVPRLVPGA